jgi:hypothetical protein
MSFGYECVDMFSINRKEKGKKTAKKYHTVGRPQTPMESPYKGAHMYMTAKFPELLQAFCNVMVISVFKMMLKIGNKLYFSACCVSFFGEYISQQYAYVYAYLHYVYLYRK